MQKKGHMMYSGVPQTVPNPARVVPPYSGGAQASLEKCSTLPPSTSSLVVEPRVFHP